MTNPYPVDSFEYLWYLSWMPLVATGIALAMGVMLWASTKNSLYGTSMRVLMAIAIYGTIPLAVERIGFGIAGDSYVTIFVNILGMGVSVGLLVFHGLVRMTGDDPQRRPVEVFPAPNRVPEAQIPVGSPDPKTVALRQDVPMARTTDGQRPFDQMADDGKTVFLGKEARDSDVYLLVSDGSARGAVCPVSEGGLSIGRAGDSDLHLEDSTVSRAHALVRRIADKLEIVDLGSRSGTKVNGRRVVGQKIRAGSVVRVGSTELQIVEIKGGDQAADIGDGTNTVFMGALKDKTQLTAVVRQGPDAGSTFDLDHEETIIGRDSDCAIRLNDSAASRTHAVIRKQGQSYAISDLGSNNGTFVDGRKLSGMTIKHGDNIELGRTRLSVVSPAVAA